MTPEELERRAERSRAEDARFCERLRVCTATSCASLGSAAIQSALNAEITRRGSGDRCVVKPVGCLGLCAAGPLVLAEQVDGPTRAEHLLRDVRPEQAASLLDGFRNGFSPTQSISLDLPFFQKQLRIVSEAFGRIDPEQIDDAIAAGAYRALLEALHTRTPAEVLTEIDRSGLRGRGGAGYPTGLKWHTVAKAESTQKYVVCNADEGDPGAFMDRSILESDPHRVLEGMALAAHAVGASEGFVYVRAEYLLAIERLRKAIHQANRVGLLGSAIGDTAFRFHVEVRLGAGAYVCGEETALLASLAGGRGTPRPRPPYPAASGLFGAPTLINNVETFANVPAIIARGGDWFASIGTGQSTGTKVFALAGKIAHTGVVEVPMGTTLREIVFELGGGIPDGARCKAIQTGGPSGGCIPARFLDTPVDYENLVRLGSIMGSGGLIVMDEQTCMVDIARFFMAFCREESCGKCVPCRVGTVELHQLLDTIASGRAEARDMELLEEFCDLVRNTSLCGLGQSAPNPVLSTLRHFPEEYLAHLRGHCPAGICIREMPAEGTTR